jgi:DNA-directed RNA polymerase specialized sigma24 family protein
VWVAGLYTLAAVVLAAVIWRLATVRTAFARRAAVLARAAEVVKLCFFVGLTQEQAAKELGISLATAERLWSFARAWLFQEMQKTLKPTP